MMDAQQSELWKVLRSKKEEIVREHFQKKCIKDENFFSLILLLGDSVRTLVLQHFFKKTFMEIAVVRIFTVSRNNSHIVLLFSN